jgi:hypothetical protein
VANITIDGKEYDVDKLSDEVKGQLGALQFSDAEIQRLQAQLAMMQTARGAYANALKTALEKGSAAAPSLSLQGDTIQFN